MAQCITNTFLQGKPFLPLPKKNFQQQQGKKVGNFGVWCGTQKEYVVDVWSGNHQFYLGNRSSNMVSDDQVEKFRKRYGELAEIMEIPVLRGEIVIPSRRKGIKSGKKK
ncbi:60S ribosomal protein L31, variant 2 [Lathyrus oleraceus]|uniref:Large ribosomal subunit protein bL31c n=1 Tax=Pisum sativum TaxID=3888 RepID=A0A9D5A4T9_PEA|nr:60S ribosomal protein L31, variant 2 [Pisum sativum]